MPPGLPAEADEKDAADPEDGGIGDEIGDRGQLAERPQRDRGENDQNTHPPLPLRARVGRVFLELAQEQKRAEDRDRGAMAVFRLGPSQRERVEPVGKDPV